MKFRYSCNGGTIMIGNETSRVCIPNGFGDGTFNVEIILRGKYPNPKFNKYEFVASVVGSNLNVYACDWLNEDGLVAENVLYTLPPGDYAVYVYDGRVGIVKR